MNFENSPLRQLQFFPRTLPPPTDRMNDFINRVALSADEGQATTERVTYSIGPDDVISTSTDSRTNSILTAIQIQHTNLMLSKTSGQFPYGCFIYDTKTIYRLTSARNHCYVDFYFIGKDEGLTCQVLIFLVEPSHQGSFYNVRDFLINRFAKTLFNLPDYKVKMICGRAMSNQFPIRQRRGRRDWRDVPTKDGKTTRLVRLYEHCGFTTVEEWPGYVYLRPQNAQGKPRRFAPVRKPEPPAPVSICLDYVI